MRLALIGTGMMGERMARRLLDAGHDLAVYNRTKERTLGLAAAGATVAASSREAAAAADVVLTVLADPAAVRATAYGGEGLLAGTHPGALWIDVSTVSPADSREFAGAAREHGVGMVDAPASGSLGAADKGMLVLLVGGAEEDVAAAKPVFDLLARAVVHLGPSGAGSAAKLAVNGFLCAAMAAGIEAVRLGASEGIDAQALLVALGRTEIVPAWAVGKLERAGEGDLRPAFSLALADKDLRLIAETAAASGVDLPLLGATKRLYANALAKGRGELDFSAVEPLAPDED
jgi:3-hydroxyisobutyrate dehydrogenase-like beta-hydroxyacid dehydrogenase